MCALSPLEEDSSGAALIPEGVLPLVPWPSADPCRLLPPIVALLTLLLDRADTGGEENAIDEEAREFMLSTLVYWGHIHTRRCYRQWRWWGESVCCVCASYRTHCKWRCGAKCRHRGMATVHMTTGKTGSVTVISIPHNTFENMKSNVIKWVIQRKGINKHLAHLLRGVKLAEDSSDARLGRTELCGVTEGGNSEDGAEGATLVLLPREGDSCFGVEELDVADGECIMSYITKLKQLKSVKLNL